MSAYLVTDKSLSVIARSVEHFANRRPQFSEHTDLWKALDRYHNHFLTEPTYSNTEVRMAEKLFYKLLDINMLSLRERYGDADQEWGECAKIYKYDPSGCQHSGRH